jgi:hypothetical protein
MDGKISGIVRENVYNGAGGHPLSNVSVGIVDKKGDLIGATSVITKEDGAFYLDTNEYMAGKGFVQASKIGYEPQRIPLHPSNAYSFRLEPSRDSLKREAVTDDLIMLGSAVLVATVLVAVFLDKKKSKN